MSCKTQLTRMDMRQIPKDIHISTWLVSIYRLILQARLVTLVKQPFWENERQPPEKHRENTGNIADRIRNSAKVCRIVPICAQKSNQCAIITPGGTGNGRLYRTKVSFHHAAKSRYIEGASLTYYWLMDNLLMIEVGE